MKEESELSRTVRRAIDGYETLLDEQDAVRWGHFLKATTTAARTSARERA